MADQAPPEDVQDPNTGSAAGDVTASAGDSPTFPNRLRVHALAKIIGVTSKQVLAKLGELGIEARSAQSSVGRDDAETVHTAFTGAGSTDTESASSAVTTTDAPATAPAVSDVQPAAEAAVNSASAKTGATGSLFSTTAPEPEASIGTADAPSARPSIATPVFLQPEAVAEPPRARRRSRKAAGPAAEVSPGSEDEKGTTSSSADASTPKVTPPSDAVAAVEDGSGNDSPETPAPETPALETPAADPTSSADSTSSDTRADEDDDQSQPRRRRRGRRGRGRGRGDQSNEGGSDDGDGDSSSESDTEDTSPSDESSRDAHSADQAEADVTSEDDSVAEDESGDDKSGDDKSGDDKSGDDKSGDDKSGGERRSRRRSRSRGGAKSSSSTDESESTPSAERGNDESTTDVSNNGESRSDADASADDSDDDEDGSDGSSRRRRRRRRRRSSGESSSDAASSEDDPPNTVVHEREPRSKSRGSNKDEVQGITGSTRLEAKRQRRRDGRDAGRRRPPILTESEFLARRESVDRVMVVREKSTPEHGDTTQVAVLEDGVLVEHFVTSSASASMVGNVYLGRVQNVLPSMEAAFVDIGRGRNGVLYAGEVNWDAAGLGGNSRKIEQALKPGDQVLVQVSKDPVGHKGARLTTQLSLAGRYLVYVPGGSSTGISRKLPDTERKRLKEILREIVPAEAGVIIRTAAEGVSEEELARDVTRLQAQWATIEEASAKAETGKGSQPQTLYEEPDLLVKVIRDLFNEDFVKLVIEGEKAWTTTSNYIETVAADMLPKLERYVTEPGRSDVFAAHRIDEQLAKALDRKVWLPSGGTLVIDRTEAMTVVDVNTGKFTGSGGNLEETVTRNNLEAAEEVVRQMRLRDIGGMIVVDFIDMVLESNRDLVLRRLTEALGRDRTRHQVSEVTSLGLVQMTRKKLGTGLVEAFSTTCEHCQGRGIIVHPFPVESKPDDGARSGSSRNESGSARKRRGRDKTETANTAPTAPDHEHAVDPSIKRAHPVALAMAAHHDDVVDDVTPADVVDNSAASSDPQVIDADDLADAVDTASDAVDTASDDVVAASGDVDAASGDVVADEAVTSDATAEPELSSSGRGTDPGGTSEPSGGARRGRGRRKASRPAAPSAADTAHDSAADMATPVEAEAAVEQPQPEPEPVVPEPVVPEPVVPEAVVPEAVVPEAVEPVVKARRTRRVARKAAAPTADTPDAAAVFVIPATPDGPVDSEESAQAPVTVPAFAAGDAQDGTNGDVVDSSAAPVEKPRRRRAAARPAGPPVDV